MPHHWVSSLDVFCLHSLFMMFFRRVSNHILYLCLYQDRREDTQLKLSHFRRHKRKALKKVPGKTSNYPFHKPEENHPPGKDSTKRISNIIGKAADYAGSAKSKKVRPVADSMVVCDC